MPKQLSGFKGLVFNYLKANTENHSIPDGFKLVSISQDPEVGSWKAVLDIPGEPNYQRITIDSEDLMGFLWNKISMMGGEQ